MLKDEFATAGMRWPASVEEAEEALRLERKKTNDIQAQLGIKQRVDPTTGKLMPSDAFALWRSRTKIALNYATGKARLLRAYLTEHGSDKTLVELVANAKQAINALARFAQENSNAGMAD